MSRVSFLRHINFNYYKAPFATYGRQYLKKLTSWLLLAPFCVIYGE